MPGRESPWDENALAYELMQESAISLGRAAKRMEETLAALAACAPDSPAREQALEVAASATYAYVVQRDVMGLYDTERALDIYQVPVSVRALLGTLRSISR